MTIDPEIWWKLHGAATHFPIALTAASAFCEGVSFISRDPERKRAFRSGATISLVLAALGSYAAVASGLVASRWRVWGHGALLWHHLFVWPAFGLITALAVMRLFERDNRQSLPPVLKVCLIGVAAFFVLGAGYWGGELLAQ